MAVWTTWQNIKDAISKGALGLLVGQKWGGLDGPAVAAVDPADGALVTKSAIAVPGGAAALPAGVPGRLPVDETFEIAAGKNIVVHPLVSGVSWIMATGAAAAVSATGKVVTLTSKNDDSTTVAAMQALIAASASVAALLSITGTGADAFDHTYVQAQTALWASGTIPANAICVLGSDGYWWPAEADATGGLKASLTSLINGEDSSRRVLRVEQQPTASAEISASAVIVAAGTAGRIYGVLASVTAAAVVELRADGVVGGAVIKTLDLPVGLYSLDFRGLPYANGLYAKVVSGTGTYVVLYRNDA